MIITFDLALFGRKGATVIGSEALSRPESEKSLLWLLESLVEIDRIELRRFKLPPLYKSGIRYVREPPGREVWKDAIRLQQELIGDCEDLACRRVAELRNNGKKARPYIRYRMDQGRYIYHVMVQRKGGALEDPSRILGME